MRDKRKNAFKYNYVNVMMQVQYVHIHDNEINANKK